MTTMLTNLCCETTNAPGTSMTINLAGAAASDRTTFASNFTSGQYVFYVMDDGTQAEWGYGLFTSGSPNTLQRSTVTGNTANTAPSRLNFAGTTYVYNAPPASFTCYLDYNGNLINSPSYVNMAPPSGTQYCGVVLNTAGNALTVSQVVGKVSTCYTSNLGSTSSYHNVFEYGGTSVGWINSPSGTSTSYNTSSDHRLKEIHGPADGKLFSQLRVYDASWKSAPDIRHPMLLAHELAEIAPWAVQGDKDAVHEDGRVKPQMVDIRC